MIYIWIDDMRPVPERYNGKKWIVCSTVNDTMKIIRQKYKSGNTDFFLDIDNDAGFEYAKHGGDYINILKQLESMYYGGHLKYINVKIHIHSMNSVAVQNMRAIIQANSKFMSEGRLI